MNSPAMSLESAARLLELYILADIPAMLWGAPGVGKSDVVRQVAGKLGFDAVCDFRLNLRESVDLRGMPAADLSAMVTRWLRPGDLPFFGNDNWPDRTALFCDEINTAAPSVQAAAFGLILDRLVGEHRLKPGVRIIAAGNRQSDRASAQRMPSALANRFAHVTVEPDVKAFQRYAMSAPEFADAPEIIAFFGFMPEALSDIPTADTAAFASPRAWSRVARLRPGSMPAGTAAEKAIRHLAVAGIVGDARATEFCGFLDIWRTLPPLESIILNPTGAPVPNEPGILWAVSGALARKATVRNFDSIGQYADRLPGDFRTLLIMSAVKRDPALQATRTYTGFAVQNQDAF